MNAGRVGVFGASSDSLSSSMPRSSWWRDMAVKEKSCRRHNLEFGAGSFSIAHHIMPLPRHNKKTQSSKKKEDLPNRRPLTRDELQGLDEIIKERTGWAPKGFQMDAIEAQLKLVDVLCHAGTGSGKTAIVAGPHLHPSSKGKVTLMVSPLIALHEEMVSNLS